MGKNIPSRQEEEHRSMKVTVLRKYHFSDISRKKDSFYFPDLLGSTQYSI